MSTAPAERANVRIVTDEADAVLAILDTRASGGTIPEEAWQRVLSSEGYVRLKRRELAMKREFTDEAFRAFVQSPELLTRRAELRDTVESMRRMDVTRPAARALAYLPRGAFIRATVYPVIKPRTNSFVFEQEAIFVNVAAQPAERFEETLAHEMHHIGYRTACPPPGVDTALSSLTPPKQALRTWLSAFGEGLAAFAAARGDVGAAYATAEADVREAWLRGTADLSSNMSQVEQFFLDVLDERVTGDHIDKRAYEFFGVVGPWYTVGGRMSAIIEEELGRDTLIAAFCDQRNLLATYNEAAAAQERRTGEKLPRWNERLTRAFAER